MPTITPTDLQVTNCKILVRALKYLKFVDNLTWPFFSIDSQQCMKIFLDSFKPNQSKHTVPSYQTSNRKQSI